MKKKDSPLIPINIRSKNELAKRISNKYLSVKDALTLINEVKNNFDDYIKSLEANHEIAVTRDEGENFFVVSESYLNSLKESLYIESIPNLKEKILEGINEPIEECLSREELRKQCMS